MRIIGTILVLFACLALGGCGAYSDYDGIGAAASDFKAGMHTSAAESVCTNPHLLFKPDGCYSYCGRSAQQTDPDYIADCLRQCSVNLPFVQKCEEKGAWHPFKTVGHQESGLGFVGAGEHYVQVYDSFYHYQRLAAQMENAEPQTQVASADGLSSEAASRLNAIPAVAMMERGWADAADKPVLRIRRVSSEEAQAVTTPGSNEQLFCNPAGVQWQPSFDGTITVDQQVN